MVSTSDYPYYSYVSQEDSITTPDLLTIARRRWWLLAGVSIAVSSGVTGKIVQETPIYRGEFKLLVEPVNQGQGNLQAITGTANNRLDYTTQIQILWSDQVLDPIRESIRLKYPDLDPQKFKENLKITRLQDTKIIQVSYQDSDPEKVKLILEQIAQGYLQYSVNEENSNGQEQLNFVNSELTRLQDRVNQLEKKLQTFRQQHQFFDPQSQSQVFVQELNLLKQQITETQINLKETNTLYTNLQKKLNLEDQKALQVITLSQSSRYQNLVVQLKSIDHQIANKSAIFTEISPQMQNLREQRSSLVPLLDREENAVFGRNLADQEITELGQSNNATRSQLTQELLETNQEQERLKIREQNLLAAEKEARLKLQKITTITQEYENLQRELKLATETLNKFLSLRERLELTQAKQRDNWQLIDRPTQSEQAINNNLERTVLMGTIAGMLLGIGATLLAEKLDNKFTSLEDLKTTTKLPILGRIPFKIGLEEQQEKKQHLLSLFGEKTTEKYDSFPFLDAFRSLYFNLAWINPDQAIKSLVISSSVPLEGKSTISVYLAYAASTMGKKVLLIDADLRRPRVHQILHLTNNFGFSNVIAEFVESETLIQRSLLDHSFSVLTAGQIPPDPLRLFNSPQLPKLIEQWQATYDLIVFDTPPLVGLTDAKILAKHTDGMVMVANLERSDKRVLQEILEHLKVTNTPVLGLVANS